MTGLEITQLPRNPYSLGMIVRYVAEAKPFADFEFGATVHALMFQIHQGTHLIATRNDGIAGYLGWLRVSGRNAEAWLAGAEPLQAIAEGDAVVVTTFVVDRQADILPMIRAAKRLEPGRSVYWKRYFGDGRGPQVRAVVKRT